MFVFKKLGTVLVFTCRIVFTLGSMFLSSLGGEGPARSHSGCVGGFLVTILRIVIIILFLDVLVMLLLVIIVVKELASWLSFPCRLQDLGN